MQGEQIALLACLTKGGRRSIFPDIATITPEAAELDVIAMRRAAVLEDQHQFMTTALEGTHAAVVLGPSPRRHHKVTIFDPTQAADVPAIGTLYGGSASTIAARFCPTSSV